MQIEVVAEGVETDARRDLLHRSGCRWGQGYLFARPPPADEVAICPR
jgi:EAL domain-containing protein (putative c-di-GMP-specific phosphodiesterase class I)